MFGNGFFKRGKKSDSLYSRWPKDSNGETEPPALLCSRKNTEFSDQLTVSMLEAEGIPCLCIYPGDGSFSNLILGVSGEGTRIFVPQSRLEEAQALLCQAEIDENEVEESRENSEQSTEEPPMES